MHRHRERHSEQRTQYGNIYCYPHLYERWLHNQNHLWGRHFGIGRCQCRRCVFPAYWGDVGLRLWRRQEKRCCGCHTPVGVVPQLPASLTALLSLLLLVVVLLLLLFSAFTLTLVCSNLERDNWSFKANTSRSRSEFDGKCFLLPSHLRHDILSPSQTFGSSYVFTRILTYYHSQNLKHIFCVFFVMDAVFVLYHTRQEYPGLWRRASIHNNI